MIDQSEPARPPSQAGTLDALAEAGTALSVSQAARWMRRHRGLDLSRVAVATAMTELDRAGAIAALDDGDGPRRWTLAEPRRAA